MSKLNREGKVKCKKTTTRARSIEGRAPATHAGGNFKASRKQTLFFWVNRETADNPEMLKSLGLELA